VLWCALFGPSMPETTHLTGLPARLGFAQLLLKLRRLRRFVYGMAPKGPAAPLYNDADRIKELSGYDILETAEDQTFDDLTLLASRICQVPVALISLVNKERVWFKSRVGTATTDIPRDLSFCTHAIMEPNLFVVPDALADDRFSNNPLVREGPQYRFYAGMPLRTAQGHAIGTLCVLDYVPRTLTTEQHDALRVLARQVMKELYLQRTVFDLRVTVIEQRIAERRYKAQYAVTKVLADSPSLADAAPRILQAICQSLDWDVGMLWTLDQSTHLRCMDVWQRSNIAPDFETLSRVMTFSRGVGLPGRVWQTGEPSWIPDVVQDGNFPRIRAALQERLQSAFAFPIQWDGIVLGILEFFSREIRKPDEGLLQMFSAIGSQIGQFTERKRAEKEREDLISQLQDALGNIKTLRGLLPICASCKKIRDDKGYWNYLEIFIRDHSEATFSHSICPQCKRKVYPPEEFPEMYTNDPPLT
jgi:GAF domain-containing protein